MMYDELELRLSGARPSELGTRSPAIPFSPIPTPSSSSAPGLPRDGVCFKDLLYSHDVEKDEDHGPCLCQLSSCLGCFADSAEDRKGPVGLLPYHLRETPAAIGWMGGVESSAQAGARYTDFHRPPNGSSTTPSLPEGKGFVLNPKKDKTAQPPPIFPHPQMTDMLAVEEHLRWRLKELGAPDPAIEHRYGASTNNPAAMEGVDLADVSDRSEDGSVQSGQSNRSRKVSKGKSKLRRAAGGTMMMKKKVDQIKENERSERAKAAAAAATCFLPKQWTEERADVRNTAVVLTFRHFVKVRVFSFTRLFPASTPPPIPNVFTHRTRPNPSSCTK